MFSYIRMWIYMLHLSQIPLMFGTIHSIHQSDYHLGTLSVEEVYCNNEWELSMYMCATRHLALPQLKLLHMLVDSSDITQSHINNHSIKLLVFFFL